MLQLILLVYTPKANIHTVGKSLREPGLLLDHPELLVDIQRISQGYYCNPHNPPPDGHGGAKEAASNGHISYMDHQETPKHLHSATQIYGAA
jgi:hypothetical protein